MKLTWGDEIQYDYIPIMFELVFNSSMIYSIFAGLEEKWDLRGKKEVQPALAQKSGAKSNSERSLAYRSEVYKDSKKHE